MLIATIVMLCGLMVLRKRVALEEMSTVLFLMIFAAGIATGALISISRQISKGDRPLEKEKTE